MNSSKFLITLNDKNQTIKPYVIELLLKKNTKMVEGYWKARPQSILLKFCRTDHD